MLVEEVRWTVMNPLASGTSAFIPTCPLTQATSQAFHHHNATSPDTSETRTLGYTQSPAKAPSNNTGPFSEQPENWPIQNTNPTAGTCNQRIAATAARELISLLPELQVATVLVETYFEKIHWFMLLFHQQEFRDSVADLYGHRQFDIGNQTDGKTVGSVSVVLAVCALSLRLLDHDQRRQLAEHGVGPEKMREGMLTALRLRLLDVLALGSLEAVQMCVLLGSYYLYHGQPELAWPLCGCALRLGQALGLHRNPRSGVAGVPQRPRDDEAKKRCWWAIHEIDTFCSMIYGFPQSISDSDCSVSPLDPNDPWSIAIGRERPSPGQPTLLEYKCAMVKLSKIIKSTLSEVYGTRGHTSRGGKGGPSRARDLVEKVASLDARLTKWHSDLPRKLIQARFGPHTEKRLRTGNMHGLPFKEQLFKLQALALKLAFENTRILIHRPLFAYKATRTLSTPGESTSLQHQDPLSLSVQACRDASLQISWSSHAEIFEIASTTYALSFVSLHLLTAGVTLCIMASIDPLGPQAQEWKLGIRRLISMLVALKSRTVLAEQGLELLRKLLKLVMEKETEKMLCMSPPAMQATHVEPVADNETPPGLIALGPQHAAGVGPDYLLTTDSTANPELQSDIYGDNDMTQTLQGVENGMSAHLLHFTEHWE